MIYNIVSIKDRATDAFSRPAFFAAIGQAIRTFGDEINRREQNNEMSKHPDDYDLYELGTWDDNTGEFTSFDQPKQIAIGKQLFISLGEATHDA